MLWGTTGTARALGPDDASPVAVGALRLVCGGALLVAVAWRMGWLRPADLRQFRSRWPVAATLVAAGAMAAYQPLFFAGVARTGVAVGTVVGIGASPVFAGVLGVTVRGERPGPAWVVATALATAGTVLLLGPASDVDVDPVGIALALGAGASYAVYVLASKLALDRQPPEAVVPVTFGLAALALVPVAAVAGVGEMATWRGVAVVAHLAIATVAVAYVLFGRGLAGVDVATTGTLTLAEPATAAVLGVAVVGERLQASSLAGVGLIGAGLLVLATARGAGAHRPEP
jgi:DME family drug/metabolite transporter